MMDETCPKCGGSGGGDEPHLHCNRCGGKGVVSTKESRVLGLIEKIAITICYTNHRGETRLREIVPDHLEFGATKGHSERQWILHAWDEERKAFRSFVLKDVIFVR